MITTDPTAKKKKVVNVKNVTNTTTTTTTPAAPPAAPAAPAPAPAAAEPEAKRKGPRTAKGPQVAEFLRIHNAARKDVGVAPLAWSADRPIRAGVGRSARQERQARIPARFKAWRKPRHRLRRLHARHRRQCLARRESPIRPEVDDSQGHGQESHQSRRESQSRPLHPDGLGQEHHRRLRHRQNRRRPDHRRRPLQPARQPRRRETLPHPMKPSVSRFSRILCLLLAAASPWWRPATRRCRGREERQERQESQSGTRKPPRASRSKSRSATSLASLTRPPAGPASPDWPQALGERRLSLR